MLPAPVRRPYGHMSGTDATAKLTPASFSPNAEETDPAGDPSIQLALLAAIVQSSDDAIVSKTLEGRILSWNAGATRIFGWKPEEAIGQPITIIIPAELHDEERRILARVRAGERIDHFDTVRVTRDGRRLQISLTVSPVRDARGVIVAASKIARDVTERKLAEQIMRRNEDNLREADRRKNEFLALLAHELRNPLAPIRYALAATRKVGCSAEQRRHAAEVVDRQVTHMTRLLDDLLDISRITHGTLELKRQPTELHAVITMAVETARPVIDAKQHHLSLLLPEKAVHLDADPVRLAQVFANLIINAAKYTDSGGHIELEAGEQPDGLEVTVRDDGIGISAEMMPRLFTLFAQAQVASKQEGLGVGLSLVRGLVALHGGTVEARSFGLGQGSEFTVRLPLGSAAPRSGADDSVSIAPAAAPPMKILVVDDSCDAADICATLLELSGHRVQTAYSGRRALELAEEFRPQLLLLDIGLPDIDGYQLARSIRAMPWGQTVHLVAITGWGQEEDRRRAAEVGFDRHLTKPVAAEALDRLLRSLASEPRGSLEAH
jgi:two-component system, chemotaxis family, CheB/CheR fusion protein